MERTSVAAATLVPHGRLAALLAHRRRLWGMTLAEVASRSARFSEAGLAAVEAGEIALDVRDVHDLAASYAVRAGQARPRRGRLILDLEERVLGPLAELDALAVIERYAALVAMLRGGSMTERSARGADVLVLAECLDLTPDLVRERLRHPALVLEPEAWVADAGLLVGPAPVGALVIVPFPQPCIPELLERVCWPPSTVAPFAPAGRRTALSPTEDLSATA